MVDTVIKDKIEKHESLKPSTNIDALLTRNEFLTAMQLMEKRFEDINRRFDDVNKRFEDQKEFMEKRFDDANKRFNFIQWLIGIGFVAIPLIGTFLENILN